MKTDAYLDRLLRKHPGAPLLIIKLISLIPVILIAGVSAFFIHHGYIPLWFGIAVVLGVFIFVRRFLSLPNLD